MSVTNFCKFLQRMLPAIVVIFLLSQSVSAWQRYYPPRFRPQQPPVRPNYNPYPGKLQNQYIRNLPQNAYRQGHPNFPGVAIPLSKAPANSVIPQRPRNSASATNNLLPTTDGLPTEVGGEYNVYPRMVAEFEPQRAIMLSVCDLQSHHQLVLKQIVDKSAGYAEILILYNTEMQLKQAVDLLEGTENSGTSPTDQVSFYKLDLDTVWLRDFGPRIAEDDSETRSFDFFYYGVRPYDDSFPERWALETAGRLTKVPWTLQGGNLLSNGQGLGITTRKIFDDNQVSIGSSSGRPGLNNEGQQFVLQQFKSACNLRDLVVLEPLQNESTKHVDMFATLLAKDHALVARVNPRADHANARILDWNARKLAAQRINGKPMRVDRIDIPPRQGESWSTYTNTILTDRLVLMPVMKTDGRRMVENAITIYRKLLPNHHIATVDITSMKDLQGSLHCMSLNLPAFAPLPAGIINFDRAKKVAARLPAANPDQQSANTGGHGNRYKIDQQLRRIFQSAASDYLVDAYAVGLQNDVVTLMRVNDKRLIRVRVTGLCQTDQYWINRNANKIQANGARVQRYVMSKTSK